MAMTITWDIPEREQESSLMNATLGTFADGVAISVACHVACPAHIDASDRDAVEAWLHSVFDPVEGAGCGVEIQIGPEKEA